MTGKTELDISHVEAARARIKAFVHETPVMTASSLDKLSGARLYFKCENFQRTGSFKYRGATNAVQSLTQEQAAHGVATHSSGNHGAALALAARQRGIAAHVVVPEGAVKAKVDAIARYGGQIHFCENSLASRDAELSKVVTDTNAHVIHPFDDPRIIAGQGTAALELVEVCPNLDVLLTPVGGGGLISGTALVAAGERARTRHTLIVIGAEPAGADDAARSLETGTLQDDITPNTICDGLRATIGPQTFAVMRHGVARILTVDDELTATAMRELWHRMKIIVEPSCAVTLAVILKYKHLFSGQRVGVVLSGGNVNLDNLPW